MLQKLHRALSGYDNYSVSSKGSPHRKSCPKVGCSTKKGKILERLINGVSGTA